LLPLEARAAGQLERQLHVLQHGAPVVEHGRLKDDPVVTIEASLM
jgi:hypothetical protein